MIVLPSLRYRSTAIQDAPGRDDTNLVNAPRTIPTALAEMTVARRKIDPYIQDKLARFSHQQLIEFLIALVHTIGRRDQGIPGEEPVRLGSSATGAAA